MALTSAPSFSEISVLLSATGASTTDANINSLPIYLFGEPIISEQLERLRKLGVRRFWIEVDSIQGAIVAMADKFRQEGLTIDFIRSPQELSGKMAVGDKLLVQSEGILADEALLSEMMSSPNAVIATLDSREENETFERIDLNTRWTGLALFGNQTIEAIAALPDGWNIASSLLRQALQDNVPQKALKQSVVQSGFLTVVSSHNDADVHSKKILLNKIKQAYGFIESVLFRPLISRLAPAIWQMKSGRTMLNVATFFAAISSLGAALTQFAIASATLGLLTTFLMGTRSVIQRANDRRNRLFAMVIWSALGIALIMMLWRNGSGMPGDLFPAIIIFGMAFHAQRFRQSGWRRYIEFSPALICLYMLFFAGIDRIVAGAMVVSIFQLLALLVYQLNSPRQ